MTVPPLPNIALFTSGRYWTRDEDNRLWRSNDGWEITDQQIWYNPEDGRRVAEMLREHVARREKHVPRG